jgi:hypothetical protein
VWDESNTGYRFSDVTFQVMAKPTESGTAQYIFLPRLSNPEAAALLADGGFDNDLKIQIILSWNGGKSQQFYTYSDELLKKVFDGTNRWVFDLKVTGIGDIPEITAAAVVVSDCGIKIASSESNLVPVFPKQLQTELGYMVIPSDIQS